MQSHPTIGVRLATGATFRRGTSPCLTKAVCDALKKARPGLKVVGVQIPQCVTDASRDGRALFSKTFSDAWDALTTMIAVPIETLYAVGFAFISNARIRRGLPALDLSTAMRAEEQANAALNLRQWCGPSPMTTGEKIEMRERVITQIVTSFDLLFALDEDIARDEARAA